MQALDFWRSGGWMAGGLGAVVEKAHFFANALAEFDTSAALLPSSQALVRAMLEPLPLAQARVVVEFGPGTGVMTRGLLARLRPDARLYAIELDPTLHATLARTITDPRLRLVQGDAASVREILRQDGCTRCDALLSSLGLSLMPPAVRETIWRAAREVLAPGAVATQFAYLHAKYCVMSPSRWRPWRFDTERFLRERFVEVSSRRVWRNLPPAVVLSLRSPRPHLRIC